jgi:hypothetical protein
MVPGGDEYESRDPEEQDITWSACPLDYKSRTKEAQQTHGAWL